MAYIGIGYSGADPLLFQTILEKHKSWLEGDRQIKSFGDSFIILYDSNTAREFAHKCLVEAPQDTISLYQINAKIDHHKH